MKLTLNYKNLAFDLLLILLGTLLFAFFVGGGLGSLLYNLMPGQVVAWIRAVNQIPGGDWFYSGSYFIWNGERLYFNAYNYFFFVLLPVSIFLAICWGVLRYHRIQLDKIGLAFSLSSQGKVSDLPIVGMTFLGYLAIMGSLLFFVHPFGLYGKFIAVDWKVRSVTAIFPGPILEEIFFRGIVFYVLEKHFHVGFVLVVSSIFFGLIHCVREPLSIGVICCIPGFYLGWLYLRTRSLFIPIVGHTLINIISSCLVVAIENK